MRGGGGGGGDSGGAVTRCERRERDLREEICGVSEIEKSLVKLLDDGV